MSHNLNNIVKEENYFEKWINLYGREKRGSYFWNFIITLGLLSLILCTAILLTDVEDNERLSVILVVVLGILWGWFIFVFGIRRARDVGFTGRGYIVFDLIPLVGIIILFLPTDFMAREKSSFFFRQKDNINVIPNSHFNQQYVNPHQGMQAGYVNQQYAQFQQMSGQQNVYGNQQYAQPQQMSAQQNVYANQQYAQTQQGMQAGYVNGQYVQPQQMSGQQNVYGNQQNTQTQQGMQNVYANQQYVQQNPHQNQVEEVQNMNQTEEVSVFGDKLVSVNKPKKQE